jgi:hypothetical protein
MNESFLIIFGLFVTILAIGPLAYAAYLDSQNKE